MKKIFLLFALLGSMVFAQNAKAQIDSLQLEKAFSILSNDKKVMGRHSVLVKHRELERLYTNYLVNTNEHNAILLKEEITKLAKEKKIYYVVNFKTAKGDDYTEGATVKFQTSEQRKKNREPRMTNEPTPSKMRFYLGWYYIWTERGDDQATSSKDQVYFIDEKSEYITIQEN